MIIAIVRKVRFLDKVPSNEEGFISLDDAKRYVDAALMSSGTDGRFRRLSKGVELEYGTEEGEYWTEIHVTLSPHPDSLAVFQQLLDYLQLYNG